MTPSDRDGSVYDYIESLDKKYTDGHARHNKLFDEYHDRIERAEQRIEKLERAADSQAQMLGTLERRKVEITNVRFNPATVIGILSVCVAIVVGGQKWATSGIQDQIALINVQLEARKQHEEDLAKLQDERASNVQRQVTQIGGQVTMIDTKLSNLRETIAGRKQ